jgi:hypothetical protein
VSRYLKEDEKRQEEEDGDKDFTFDGF